MPEETMVAFTDGNISESPSGALEEKGQKHLLDQAMKYLPSEDTQLLTLFYMAEQSVDEIGLIIGATSGNVKVRLFRARQKLKVILERRFSNELI